MHGPHLFVHNACLVLDALREGTPLRTDGDLFGFHRTRRDEQSPYKHREARNAQAEGGGGLDISMLPDNNMTRIVVSFQIQHDSYVVYRDGSSRIITLNSSF